MSLTKFGQYVKLEVVSGDGRPVLETDSLRIDFDIHNTFGWLRAKIDIYNLSDETIRKLLSGGDKFVTLTTSLHGGKKVVLAKQMIINNAVNERVVPNSIVSLFCYSKLKKTTLEKQVNLEVSNPSLVNVVTDILHEVLYDGKVIYKQFPDNYVELVPDKPTVKIESSVISALDLLGRQYRFEQFIDGDDLIIMYKVHPRNSSITSLNEDTNTITLNTNNMRANPKIGVAQVSINSNLDAGFKPSGIIDISKLLTASADLTDEELQLLNDSLSLSAGRNKYQITTVQHVGSNFTDKWSSYVYGLAPTEGFTVSTNKSNWFR